MTDPSRIYAQAVDALNQGRWQQALALADSLLSVAAGHAGVHFVAGVAALQMGAMPRALGHLETAVRLNPSRPDYAAQWARALSSAAMAREALEVARRALAQDPKDPMTLDTLGVVFTLVNAHEEAARAFRDVVALRPEIASYRFNLGTSLSILGDMDGAEREHEACLARDPRYWKAHLALAQLRRQNGQSNHVERLSQLLEQARGDRNGRMYLHLALAKELEDLGREPESFEHLRLGKQAGGEGRSYDFERDRAMFDAIIGAFPDVIDVSHGHDSAEPIFVIGMPRSGTTLVERILSSHLHVHSAGELPNFGFLLKRMSGSRTPALLDADTLRGAASIAPADLGRAYVESTRPGTGQSPRFIDKLPHNFLYAGHIARALPNARIVCLRRDPVDTVLSNFRQLFSQGSQQYDYSFDLLDSGRYYLQFERLMAHWRQVLPNRILEIGYEEIVDDQESCTRRLLAFCGLPWDDACLAFERNAAPVATASLAQVRSPLYRTSMLRWKRYEAQLAELLSLLREGGIAVD
ncbi:tetratricopeptide repeat-containing sulfotransferase family protein [Pseudoxanthomonas koreensis]|uniref:tetratricopeptide repeat-containing sulfotransferase family protein n=1 Tax=Pseudoxanthomonas koreensis TaxID=266061 RepID=UPI001391FE99|nr:sulfotransferase [Pseudoxanthomonas koreensis]KAF1695698.1 sulfotransferase [Pseudoxanthomonas koreensis]